ncbi:MAG: NADP-dependent oxidoreductase [Janthinobacterium lividum]
MKAAVIERYGAPEVFSYRDMPEPVAGDGEVVVRIAAAGVNPVDGLDRAGGTKDWRPLAFPAIIGWDVSGVVESIGAGVADVAPGDRVMAWAFATYAEKVALKADLLARVPEGIDLVEAAALPLGAMTGTQLVLVGANVAAGQTVLVSGAVGTVGRAAVFAAKDRGARVIAAVRGSQVAEAGWLGADEVVALDDEAALTAIGTVDVVANTVRGPVADRLLELVGEGGTFASVTGASGGADRRPDVRVVAFVSKQDAANLAYVAEGVRSGRLTVPIDCRLPLERAREAHERLAKPGAGKILLVP